MRKFIISCEHGGNHIPEEYNFLFKKAAEELATHRGWDIGILPVAKEIAKHFKFNLTFSEISRLLVELNRSEHAPDLFSSYTFSLSSTEKEELLSEYYFPYRDKVKNEISRWINLGYNVIHLSFHSFTPVLSGIERQCDIGLLFDSERKVEKTFCEQWKEALQLAASDLRVEYNYPYQGTDDGFTTYLRNIFPENRYGGIELEINQKLLTSKKERDHINQTLKSSMEYVINQ